MSLQLKLDLPFEGDIMFSGFVPDSQADVLHLCLHEGKYRVTVCLSDPGEQLRYGEDELRDPERLKRRMNIFCKSLTMEIVVAQADPDVRDALEADTPTEATARLGQELFDLVVEVHTGLIGYFRSMAQEYWLHPVAPDPRNYEHYLKHIWGVTWLDSSGAWRPFPVPRERTQHLTSHILERGVDRQRWAGIRAFIEERGGLAPMREVLIANSMEHLDQNNGRLAVVEAVIALESTIRQLLGRVILALPGTPQIEEALLDKIIEKAGLRLVTQVGLKMVATLAGLDLGDIEKVIEAVEKRHSVVHGPQRDLSISLARGYVVAIRRVINTLESWTESGAGN